MITRERHDIIRRIMTWATILDFMSDGLITTGHLRQRCAARHRLFYKRVI